MNNDELFAHLSIIREELEAHDGNDPEGGVLNYLYLANQLERMSIHLIEYAHRRQLGLSLTQKNQRDILTFRPYFDAALIRKEIASLTSCPFPATFGETGKSGYKK